MQDEDYVPIDKVTALKTPPHSIDAEQAVLGVAMENAGAIDWLADTLGATDFYRKEHQLIFTAMLQLAEENQAVDSVTVVNQLEDTRMLDAAGGVDYVLELTEQGFSARNIRAYAGIVKERAVMRQLIGVCHGIADSCYNPDGRSMETLLNNAQQLVMDIRPEERTKTDVQVFRNATQRFIAALDERSKRDGTLLGHSTGLRDLDALIHGLIPKDLIVLAGRPSMGKTTVGLNWAEAVAMAGKPALFFSLEMPEEGLLMRTYSNLANIPIEHLRTAQMRDDYWDRLTQSISKCKDMPLYIDETPAMTTNMMRARARRTIRMAGQPLGCIVVDYMQQMRSNERQSNREGEISEISRSLKAMAKEFDCPVIALSQLNRSLENRPVDSRRPRPSDLRDSGSIEQDADIICFVYRDVVYNPNSPHKGTCELIIGKHRNGRLGTVYARDELEYSRVVDAPERKKKTPADDIPSQEQIDGLDFDPGAL